MNGNYHFAHPRFWAATLHRATFSCMCTRPSDVTPPTISALIEAIRGDHLVRIVGTRTMATRIPEAPPTARTISTKALAGLVVDPLNLIARADAGVRISDLRDRLHGGGVVWPVETLEPTGTIGGLIASGRGSAILAEDMPARRWILGSTIVLTSGQVISSGGVTVKNSSGYAITHAMWGSRGRLAVLASVTIRLRHATKNDNIIPDRGCEHSQVLASECEVRAEEIPSNWGDTEWNGIAPGLPRAVSSDGTRALIGCPNIPTASSIVHRIEQAGGWASIDRPPAEAELTDSWRTLAQALDPLERLV